MVSTAGLTAPPARIVNRAASRTFVPALGVLEVALGLLEVALGLLEVALGLLEGALGVDVTPAPHAAKRTVTTPAKRTARRLTFAG